MRSICAKRALTTRSLTLKVNRMVNTVFRSMLGMVVGLATWTLGAPAARAQELCDGHVCPEGFTCVTTTSTCPADDPTCDAFTETYCQSPACATDADCPAGRRCRVTTFTDCGSPVPGSGGDGTTPAECTQKVESWCHMAYDVECETSAQCGPGFTCKPLVDCDCSDPEAPVPPDCACEYTRIKGCYSPVVACTAATATTDCASGWSCVENTDGICNEVGDFHGGCNPGEPPMVCIPPGFQVGSALTDDAAAGDLPSDASDDAFGAPTSSGGGGCSLAGPSSVDAGALLAGLSALLVLGRRRRRA